MQPWTDFPAAEAQACEAPLGLTEALGAPIGYTAKNAFDYLVEVGSETIVRKLRPDFLRLATLLTRCVIVTGPSDAKAFDSAASVASKARTRTS